MNRGLAFLKTVGAALFPRLLGLAIALFGFYSFFFAEPTSHVVVINRELGISGEVSVISAQRFPWVLDLPRLVAGTLQLQ